MNNTSENVCYLTAKLLRTENIDYKLAKDALSNTPLDAATFYAVSGRN